jgi:hypothetical protein
MSAAAAGRVIAAAQFETFCSTGDVLEARLGRPVLIAHTDPQGRRLETRLWRRKGPFSSDRLRPYSERFVHAAAALRRLGVEAPVVRASGRVSAGMRFVTYEPVAGRSLREIGASVDRAALARFVLELHDLGVYCRGLNLGNLIQLPDGRFGLADVAQTRFKAGPLSRRQRERNLGILCSHPQDLGVLAGGPWSELVMAYCRAAGVSLAAAAQMRERVRLQVERRNARRAVAAASSAPASAGARAGVDPTAAAEAALPRS